MREKIAKAGGRGAFKCGVFGHVDGYSGDTDSANQHVSAINRNASRVNGIRIGVVGVFFPGDDAQRFHAADWCRRFETMSFKFRGKGAVSIGVFDSVEVSGRLISYSRRHMDAADKTNS